VIIYMLAYCIALLVSYTVCYVVDEGLQVDMLRAAARLSVVVYGRFAVSGQKQCGFVRF
jgi:hypothetical protein